MHRRHFIPRLRMVVPPVRTSAPGPEQQPWSPWWSLPFRAAREAGLVAVLYVLYDTGRVLVQGQESVAAHHARLVHRFEARLPLPSEAWLQEMAGHVPDLFELANRYYISVHFPLMIAFLLWGFLLRPARDYAWARNLLVVQTFLALAIHLIFPLAPPRMFPEWGFVDTGALVGPSPYQGSAGEVANQFAAMPSLHIGWAVLIAVVLTRTASRPLAIIAWLHAAATVLVVVITANHWWVDGIVSSGLLGLALVVFPAPGRTRLPRSNRHSARPS